MRVLVKYIFDDEPAYLVGENDKHKLFQQDDVFIVTEDRENGLEVIKSFQKIKGQG